MPPSMQSFCGSVLDAFQRSELNVRGCPGGGLYWCGNNVNLITVMNKFDLSEIRRTEWRPDRHPAGVGGTDKTLWLIDSEHETTERGFITMLDPNSFATVVRQRIRPGSNTGDPSFGVGGTDRTVYSCGSRDVRAKWTIVEDDQGNLDFRLDHRQTGDGLEDSDGIGGDGIEVVWHTAGNLQRLRFPEDYFEPGIARLNPTTLDVESVTYTGMPADDNLEGVGGSSEVICAAGVNDLWPDYRARGHFFLIDPGGPSEPNGKVIKMKQTPNTDPANDIAGAGGKPLALERYKQEVGRAVTEDYYAAIVPVNWSTGLRADGRLSYRQINRMAYTLPEWQWFPERIDGDLVADDRGYEVRILKADKHVRAFERADVKILRGANEINAFLQGAFYQAHWTVTDKTLMEISLVQENIRLSDVDPERNMHPQRLLAKLHEHGAHGIRRVERNAPSVEAGAKANNHYLRKQLATA